MAHGHRELIQNYRIPLLKMVAHSGHNVGISCSTVLTRADFHIQLCTRLFCSDCAEVISEEISALQVVPGVTVENRYPALRNIAGSRGICLQALRMPGEDTVYAEKAVILMQNGHIDVFTRDEFRKYLIIKGIIPQFMNYKYDETLVQEDIKSGMFEFLK